MPPEFHLAGPVEAARPREEIPVARPARPAPVPPPLSEALADGPALTPGAVRGWATSLALHALLLIVLGLWIFSTQHPERPVIDTRLGAGLGDPNGVEGGTTLLMGGRDDPMSLPAAPPPELIAGLAPAEIVEAARPDRPILKGITRAGPKLAQDPDVDGKIQAPGRGGGSGGDGFGTARYGRRDGSIIREKVQGVDVKVGDPQFTLLWDTQADLDLHVTEPGGAEYSWIDPNGGSAGRGGELDVDNKLGFGPENIFWVEERGDDGKVVARGQGPPGEYKWFVHYYGGHNVIGQKAPTRWKVRLKHDGQVTVFQGTLIKGQRSKVYTFLLGLPPATSKSGGADEMPGEEPARSLESKKSGKDRGEAKVDADDK